jgi:hypothetical protein
MASQSTASHGLAWAQLLTSVSEERYSETSWATTILSTMKKFIAYGMQWSDYVQYEYGARKK